MNESSDGRDERPADSPTQPAVDAAPRTLSRNVLVIAADLALFNLDLNGGAYACARCHTKGWSYGDPQQSGGGALGPNLTNGDTVRQFPNEDDHVTFVETGSENGKKYGQQGQGSGRMPGFGQLLTPEQLQAIVEYERSL